MPWTLDYTPHGADVRFADRATGEEIYEVSKRILEHSKEQPLAYTVFDFSNTQSFDVTPEDMIRLADQDKAYLEHHSGFPFVVITSRATMYGLTRMYQVLMDDAGFPSNIVETRADALAWLRRRGCDVAGLEV